MKLIPDFLRRKFQRDETPETADDYEGSLEAMREKLSGLLTKKNGKHARNAVLILAGGGLAIAGVAADVMFLGGMGTATVVGILYSDLRNAQHIKKISNELAKIDEKIDAMKTAQQPVEDYAPALSAMRTTIADFEASAKKLPPDAREGLDRLKGQVAALEKKIANDDGAQAPAKPAAL